MAKSKTVFVCQHCGGQSPKWAGKCPYCAEWNTLFEEVVEKQTRGVIANGKSATASVSVKRITDLTDTEDERIVTSSQELNRVLGGGIILCYVYKAFSSTIPMTSPP